MTDSGGFYTPRQAVEAALDYVNKQNPKGFKEPKEEQHYCMDCGTRIAKGNGLCGECACEDDCDPFS